MIIHGKDLIVSIGNTPVALSKSCEIDVSCDEIETSSAQQGGGRWRTYIAGRCEWAITCSTLVSALKSNVQRVGTTVTINVGIRNTQDTLTGSAIVKSYKATGTMGNLAQGGITFRGSGALMWE